MNSRIFAQLYLDNEDDIDIEKAQYVVISTRIRRRSTESIGEKVQWPNITIQSKALFPNRTTMSSVDSESFLMNYYDQLDEYIGFLAYITNAVAKNPNEHIIFICSEKEDKNFHFLPVLAEFIYDRFGYPCYNYELYVYRCETISYNKDKVIKKTKKIIDEETKKRRRELMISGKKRYLMNEYERMTKKDLKQLLKEEDLYEDTMSRKEMLEVCELYLT